MGTAVLLLFPLGFRTADRRSVTTALWDMNVAVFQTTCFILMSRIQLCIGSSWLYCALWWYHAHSGSGLAQRNKSNYSWTFFYY